MPGRLSSPQQRRLGAFLIVLLLIFSPAFVCANIPIPGLNNREDTPPAPTEMLDSGSGSLSGKGDEPAAIGESDDEASESAEADQETSPDTTEKPTTDQPSSQANLADEQILILPGGNPPTLDPHLSGDATSAEYVVEVFSGLMAYDPAMNLIPDIAESYNISDDGLVYTFKISPAARFQDGKPVRAQDFKWSFERACDPATGSHTADTYLGDIVGCRARLQNEADEVSGVEVIDDLTLRLTIDEPKGFFLAKMTYPTAYVLDQENVESGGPTWFMQPNGSGPFKVSVPNPNMIVLQKNENYYRDPQPVLDQVIYLINVSVDLITGYQNGFPDNIVDALDLPTDATYAVVPVALADYSRVTDPNNPLSDEVESTEALSVFYIGFNVQQPPFDEVEVRRAFNLALDKERVVKAVYRGTVPVANSIVPPVMPDYESPEVNIYEFDQERALELIAESSYGDVTELPPITLHVSGAGDIVEAVVKSYEQNLGITLEVEELPWPEFLQGLNRPDNPYQMYQLGWIADYPDPQNFLEVLFHTESAQNHSGYGNPDVDALLDKARGTLDVDDRMALYRQAEQLILEDAVWIPLTFDVENWLVKPYVQNYVTPPIKVPKFQYVSIAEH
ncbi:MAG: peptide ABC transporter substrate-binding protein [Anaerolineae bacterium]|nr:peptide ABC transporter substrate-binding protein [Anaerolineae bacterium]